MPDPLYIRARSALLDAVDALRPHLDGIVLVGAQAIYLHTGDADLSIAAYTTDADFALSPGDLAITPLLADALLDHGFTPREQPGRWLSRGGSYVDIMVPEAFAGLGRRGARLGAHGARTARRARGLEAALVDRDRRTIGAFDPGDSRTAHIWVAGPAALLVAKVHKIAERTGAQDRVRDKDALDVLRLLRAVSTEELAARIGSLLRSDIAAEVTRAAVGQLRPLFGGDRTEGVVLAVRSGGGAEDAATIAGSFVALVSDLIDGLEGWS
ncbi:MAG: hypothetical protein ACREQM_04890 [Candidatus Dormibacteraceae bacterium]